MTLEEKRDIYLRYLEMKIVENDWHAAADCAMDLRELEVELKIKLLKNDISSNSSSMG